MIWWWVASAAATALVAALASDDSSDDDKNRQEERMKSEAEAKRRYREQAENLARQEADRNLFTAQNLAIIFLKNNFNNQEPFSDSIRLLKTPYSLKLKIGEIVNKYPCKDIEILTIELKENQSKLNQINNALYELEHLMDSIND